MNLELIKRIPENSKNSRTILFVHGAYHAAWCWEEHFLDYFAKSGYSTYALSLRGHGNSECSEIQRVSFGDYLEDIDLTIRKIGEPMILAGHSLGGMLVQKYIEQNPVSAAIMISASTPQGLRALGKRFLRLYPFQTLQMLLTSNPDIFWHSSKVIQNCFLPHEITQEKRSEYTRWIVRQSEPGKLMLKELMSLKFNRPEKTQPILVIKGKQDKLIQDKECELLASIHEVKPIILDHLSHDLMLGAKWKLAADTILQWLQSEGLH